MCIRTAFKHTILAFSLYTSRFLIISFVDTLQNIWSLIFVNEEQKECTKFEQNTIQKCILPVLSWLS